MKLDIFLAIVLKTRVGKVREKYHQEDTEEEDTVVDPMPNATSAARLGTLRGPAPRQLRVASVEEEAERPATPAVALATCLVIASRGPSATIATELGTFPRIAHNLSGERATLVAPKDTSRVIAPTRAQLPKLMKRGEMFF